MKKLGVIAIMLSSLFSSRFSNIQAQDWPNLKRYQEENAKLTSPGKKEQRVVFMGNSITEGWERIHPAYFADNPYICRGISGQTTPQMLIRFRQDVVDLEPAVVVILAGINDIAGNTGPSTLEMIMDNLKSMTEIAKANGIEVVLCSVLPANHFPWRPEKKPADDVIELNKMIKLYAKSQKVSYVDYYPAMVNDSKGLKAGLGDDGVHPNLEGYKIMEAILEKTLAKVLK